MNDIIKRRTGRVICWFSCGATSAVATKLALAKYGKDRIEIYYNDTGGEHPDNKRFLADCQRWFGVEIQILKSSKYADHFDVIESRRFLGSKNGAPCTSELKRIPSESVWELGDIEIFGFSATERGRVEKWRKNNNERILECPLIDMQLTSADCLGILDAAGIEIPTMYKLGFKHNNCIGCVKAQSVNYWKRIRLYFPHIFWRMAKLERELDYAINRIQRNGKRIRVYLDELDDSEPEGEDSTVECGLFCMSALDQLHTAEPAAQGGATPTTQDLINHQKTAPPDPWVTKEFTPAELAELDGPIQDADDGKGEEL